MPMKTQKKKFPGALSMADRFKARLDPEPQSRELWNSLLSSDREAGSLLQPVHADLLSRDLVPETGPAAYLWDVDILGK